MNLTIADLQDALSERDAHLRRSAALVLGTFGAGNRQVLNLLIDALADRDASVRLAAAQSLCKCGLPSIPRLVRALRNKPDEQRIAILQVLNMMGPAAIEARDHVAKLCKNEKLGPFAAKALTAMDRLPDVPWQQMALRLGPFFLVVGVVLEIGSFAFLYHGMCDRYSRAPLAMGFALLGAYFGAVLGGSLSGWRVAYVSAKAHSTIAGTVGSALGLILSELAAPLLRSLGP